MINICLLLTLSLFSEVEGVHDTLPKLPHKNNDRNLFLVEPGELSKSSQIAEQITEQDLADMLSGSGDLPPLLQEMANSSTGTDDVLIGSIHSLVSTISLLLNVIVIIFLCQYPTKFFRSSQSFFILHMCMSSLMLVITMMASASYRLSATWYFGRFCCNLNNWLKAFGIISQAYFCTLLLVELYFQLRHSSFINRIMQSIRVKIMIIFIGWMVAFIFSYPFWVRTTYYTSGSITTCSINTFDGDLSDNNDYAAYIHNGTIVFTMDSIATYDDDDDLYVDYDYDNQPYECHMEETSFSFRFWYGSLVILGYFIPLTVIITLFAVLKYRKTATTTIGSKAEVMSAQSKWITCFLVLVFVMCWLPLSIFKAGKVFRGLPLHRDQCLLARDIGSVLGYFSCLALPAAVIMYMVSIQRHNQRRNPSSMSTSTLKEEKKQLGCEEEAALYDVITNRCDDSEKGGEVGGDWN